MGTQLKARPTEYKNTRFRSKSEAVFARCWDLRGSSRDFVVGPAQAVMWHYENDIHSHPWDFDLWCGYCDQCMHSNFTVLIELKPCRPTATYIEELRLKCQPEIAKQGRACGSTDSYIVYGSPWQSEDYQAIPIVATDKWRTETFLRFLEQASGFSQEATRFRFDLEQRGEMSRPTRATAFSRLDAWARYILEFLMANPRGVELACTQIRADEITGIEAQQLFGLFCDAHESGEEYPPAYVLSEDRSGLALEIYKSAALRAWGDMQRDYSVFMNAIQVSREEAKCQQLVDSIDETSTPEDELEVLRQIVEMKRARAGVSFPSSK